MSQSTASYELYELASAKWLCNASASVVQVFFNTKRYSQGKELTGSVWVSEEATAGKSGWRAVRGSQRSSRLAKSLERLTSYSAPTAEPPSAAAPAAAAPQPYIGDLLDRVAILEKQLALTAHNPPPPQRAVSSLQTAESAHANPGPPRQTTGLGQVSPPQMQQRCN